jgi:hypothetical protein
MTDIFPIMLPRVRRYEKSQFQCSIISLLLVLEQKIVLTGYRKSYPRNLKMCSNLTFDLNFKVKLEHLVDFTLKMCVNQYL